jgi:dihydroneopterin aldolase/2-amino-4-hydroxy-6-hydroxymethyldihydropteridine diphosphokinase
MEPYRGAGPFPGEDGQPLDQIQLLGLSATGYHGVFGHERRDGQLFVADVVIHLDLRPAAGGDDLALTVDYGSLAEEVVAVLAGEPADLVETVSERVAAAVLRHERVAAVDVAIHKPHAPVAVAMNDVVVAIRRDRSRPPVAALPRAEAGEVSPVEPSAVADPMPMPDDSVTRPMSAVPLLVADDDLPGPVETEPAAEPAEPAVGDVLDRVPLQAVEAVLALGSNVGAPEDTLRRAVADLAALTGVEVVRVSPLARTAAVGGPEQPDFLNTVAIVRTTLAPRALLRACQQLEARHGRVRAERWGPRSLDIDIIVFGEVTGVSDDLELPHPQASQRAFVLQPWAQIAPHAVLPGLGGGPVAALAATAPDRDGIRWMAVDWLHRDEPAEAPPGASHAAAPAAPFPPAAAPTFSQVVAPPAVAPTFSPVVAPPAAAPAPPSPFPRFPPLIAPEAPDDPPAPPDGGDGTADPTPITYLP